jgi:hypothetical protein
MEEKARQPINPCFSRGRRSRAALELKAGGRHGWRVENGLGGLLGQGAFSLVKNPPVLYSDRWRDSPLDPVGNTLCRVALVQFQLAGKSRRTAEKLDDLSVFVGGFSCHGA